MPKKTLRPRLAVAARMKEVRTVPMTTMRVSTVMNKFICHACIEAQQRRMSESGFRCPVRTFMGEVALSEEICRETWGVSPAFPEAMARTM